MTDAIDMRAARALVRDERLWPLILDFCYGHSERKPFFHSFPKEDGSRLLLAGEETCRAVERWMEALSRAEELRGVMDGERVRVLRDELEDAYPDALKYAPYFARWHLPRAEGARLLATALRAVPRELLRAEPLEDAEVPLEAVWKLLKLKFPEAYALCCS